MPPRQKELFALEEVAAKASTFTYVSASVICFVAIILGYFAFLAFPYPLPPQAGGIFPAVALLLALAPGMKLTSCLVRARRRAWCKAVARQESIDETWLMENTAHWS